MNYAYLIALIASLSCLLLADWRYKLALFGKQKHWVILVLGISAVLFLAWDITGILLDVFATNQTWVSGFYVISPNLPVEEFFFLTLLSYVTVLTWEFVWQHTS